MDLPLALSGLWTGLGLIHVAAALAGTGHLLLNYRRPTAAVGWLFALWVLPLVGSLLYLLFAVYEGPRTLRSRRRLSRSLRRRERPAPQTAASRSARERVASSCGALPMTGGNAVRLHPSAAEARAGYLEAIRSARREILLETYLWTEDAFTRELRDALAERRAAGVDVRVLVDAIGSRATRGRCFEQLDRAGIPNRPYLPPSPLKGRFQINFRNHRKLLVTDGALAITGGRNCGQAYFDDAEVRDLSVEIRGPAVGALRQVFDEDWTVATEGHDREIVDCEIPEPCGDTSLRVVPHGCDEERDVFLPLVSSALRSARSSVLVVTPYLVPGATMLHDLRLAALGGAEVRILIPERTPERWPEVAARRFFEPLLAAGVEIWVRAPPFLHAKAIVVDDEVTILGSANFDQRSFFLNYELSCELESGALARAVGAYFEPDFAAARRLDPDAFARRGWKARLTENAAALFTPIL